MTEQAVQAPSKALDRKPPTFKFAYFFILLDYFSRWIVYGLWRFHLINGWLFWIIQILVISLVVFVWAANPPSPQ